MRSQSALAISWVEQASGQQQLFGETPPPEAVIRLERIAKISA
jgi:hypothetical protein